MTEKEADTWYYVLGIPNIKNKVKNEWILQNNTKIETAKAAEYCYEIFCLRLIFNLSYFKHRKALGVIAYELMHNVISNRNKAEVLILELFQTHITWTH